MDSNIYFGKCEITINDKVINLENASINITHILKDESDSFSDKPMDRYLGFNLEIKDGTTLIHNLSVKCKGDIK